MKKGSVIIIIVIIVAAWFYSERYMYVGSNEGSSYLMNKWTGKVYRVETPSFDY